MFSMCSELTPRAPIPDTRIPQLMQPWSYDCPAILQRGGEGSKFEVMTHKKDTEYSGAFCTSTLFLTFVDSNKSMRSVIFSSWMLLWEGVAFSFLSIMTESLLPLQAHNAPRAPPGPRAHRRRGAAKIS